MDHLAVINFTGQNFCVSIFYKLECNPLKLDLAEVALSDHCVSSLHSYSTEAWIYLVPYRVLHQTVHHSDNKCQKSFLMHIYSCRYHILWLKLFHRHPLFRVCTILAFFPSRSRSEMLLCGKAQAHHVLHDSGACMQDRIHEPTQTPLISCYQILHKFRVKFVWWVWSVVIDFMIRYFQLILLWPFLERFVLVFLEGGVLPILHNMFNRRISADKRSLRSICTL